VDPPATLDLRLEMTNVSGVIKPQQSGRRKSVVSFCVLGFLLPPGHDASVDGQDDAGDPFRLI
jgi:hypothetical protein